MPDTATKAKETPPAAGASMSELKEALPDSTAEFRETCHLAGLSVAQAEAMWAERQQEEETPPAAPPAPDEEQQARAVQELARAAGQGVTQKLRAAPLTAAGETDGDPEAAFELAVDELMARRQCPRHVAQAAVCRQQPELRARMVAAHNLRHGRPVPAAAH